MPILALAWQKDCQRQTDMRLVVLDKRGSDCVYWSIRWGKARTWAIIACFER